MKTDQELERRLLIGVCLVTGTLLSFVGSSHAQSVKLAWDASPTVGVTNYVLYAHTNPITAINITNSLVKVSVGTNLTATAYDIHAGKWWFGAVAQKDGVISAPSNILMIEVPEPPTNTRSVVLQYAATLTNGFYDALYLKLRIP